MSYFYILTLDHINASLISTSTHSKEFKFNKKISFYTLPRNSIVLTTDRCLKVVQKNTNSLSYHSRGQQSEMIRQGLFLAFSNFWRSPALLKFRVSLHSDPPASLLNRPSWFQRTHLDNPWSSPYLKFCNWSTSAKFLLPGKVIFSQVLGIRMWPSLGGPLFYLPPLALFLIVFFSCLSLRRFSVFYFLALWDLSFLTKNRTLHSLHWKQSINHWTTQEVPRWSFLFSKCVYFSLCHLLSLNQIVWYLLVELAIPWQQWPECGIL